MTHSSDMGDAPDAFRREGDDDDDDADDDEGDGSFS